jgi:hypothetical protein
LSFVDPDPKPTFIASTRHRKPDIQEEIVAFAKLVRRSGLPDQSYSGTGVFNYLESNEGATARAQLFNQALSFPGPR